MKLTSKEKQFLRMFLEIGDNIAKQHGSIEINENGERFFRGDLFCLAEKLGIHKLEEQK